MHSDLQRLAASKMRNERGDHTLQATALVNEAYVRLVGADKLAFADRTHFFRVAAEAMRRILIDHARARQTDKRAGLQGQVSLMEGDALFAADPSRLLMLEEAMQSLEAEDARCAEVAQLRIFGGLDIDRIAEMLGVSSRTIDRDWKYARARLSELLADE